MSPGRTSRSGSGASTSRYLLHAPVTGLHLGRRPGRLVRGEVDEHAKVRRIDPLSICDHRDLRRDRVTEELHGRAEGAKTLSG